MGLFSNPKVNKSFRVEYDVLWDGTLVGNLVLNVSAKSKGQARAKAKKFTKIKPGKVTQIKKKGNG